MINHCCICDDNQTDLARLRQENAALHMKLEIEKADNEILKRFLDAAVGSCWQLFTIRDLRGLKDFLRLTVQGQLTKAESDLAAITIQRDAAWEEIAMVLRPRIKAAEGLLRDRLNRREKFSKWVNKVNTFLTPTPDSPKEMVAVRREALEDILEWVEQVRIDYEDAATGPPLKKEGDWDPTILMWPTYFDELKKAALGGKP
jgi:hypothetical protein